MLQKLCGWTEGSKGSLICSLVATVGGLHLFFTPPQKVLGILPAFSTTIMGRTIGAQQLVGLTLTVCGLCAFGACCLPTSTTTEVVVTE